MSANPDVSAARPRRRLILWASIALLVVVCVVSVVVGRNLVGARVEPLKPIGVRMLPPPTLSQASLLDALKKRASHREFANRPLDDQTLSNLLWAAYGVNRPETGARTAPTAFDWRHMDLYIADAHGIGRYDADRNAIESLIAKDSRSLTGMQEAPVTIVIVSDEGKMEEKSQVIRSIYSGVSTGAIAQNIYLYCAGAGLNTVVRGSVDREPLHKALQLGPDQKIIVAQTIGYPPDSAAQ